MTIEIAEEIVPKRPVAWAVDWPGWCRSGTSPELARAALVVAAPRYAIVARTAGLGLPSMTDDDLQVVDTVDGGGGTEFGVPSSIIAHDRRPTTAAEADRLAGLVAAAWTVLDEVAARTPEVLRKGPRGGGRDRTKMLGHVLEADRAYAREIGVRFATPEVGDRPAVEATRAAVLAILREPSDGSGIAGRRWTQRYAARRIAWHALDHAWEMEDRTD